MCSTFQPRYANQQTETSSARKSNHCRINLAKDKLLKTHQKYKLKIYFFTCNQVLVYYLPKSCAKLLVATRTIKSPSCFGDAMLLP